MAQVALQDAAQTSQVRLCEADARGAVGPHRMFADPRVLAGHHDRLGAHRHAGQKIRFAQIQPEMKGQSPEVLQRVPAEVLIAQHQGVFRVAAGDVAPSVEKADVPPGVTEEGLSPGVAGDIAAEAHPIVGAPLLEVGDHDVAQVAHQHRIGRRTAQGPQPGPVEGVGGNRMARGDPGQKRVDAPVLGMADQVVGGVVVEVAGRIDAIAVGQGVAQHPLDPVGARLLSGDQKPLKVIVFQQRQVGAVTIEAVDPENQILRRIFDRVPLTRIRIAARASGGVQSVHQAVPYFWGDAGTAQLVLDSNTVPGRSASPTGWSHGVSFASSRGLAGTAPRPFANARG